MFTGTVGAIGEIYLLHFARPVGNPDNPRGMAQHYIGWALDAAARELEHLAGRGAALTRYAVEQGITWAMYILGRGDRHAERRIKNLKCAPAICPVCGCSRPSGPRQLSGELFLPLGPEGDDPFSVQPVQRARCDWYEISQERRWRASRADTSYSFNGQVDNVGIPF